MPSSYSLPKIMEEEIEALIDAGYYSSKSDVVKDAMRTLLETKKSLRIAAAVEMYKKGSVSIGRASEISGVSVPEFKDLLKSRGVKIVISFDEKEMKKSDRLMKKMR